jgi:hypothetical protein
MFLVSLPAPHQRCDFFIAADQGVRRRCPARRPPRARPHDSEQRHTLRHALQIVGSALLGDEQVDFPCRGRADQRIGWRRRLRKRARLTARRSTWSAAGRPRDQASRKVVLCRSRPRGDAGKSPALQLQPGRYPRLTPRAYLLGGELRSGRRPALRHVGLRHDPQSLLILRLTGDLRALSGERQRAGVVIGGRPRDRPAENAADANLSGARHSGCSGLTNRFHSPCSPWRETTRRRRLSECGAARAPAPRAPQIEDTGEGRSAADRPGWL